jgi:hypothetical protein
MAAALRSRLGSVLGRGQSSPLEVELKRATQAASIVVPPDAIEAVVKATKDAESRRVIMRHLSGCLGQTASAQWRQVYLAMLVLEELMKDGSPELVTEVANGVHFDLVQRTSFLVKYEYSFDERVQGLIRKKALQIRERWQQRQLSAMLDVCAAEDAVREPKVGPAAPALHRADDDSDDEDYLRQPAVHRKPVLPDVKAQAVDFLDLQDDSTNDGSSTSGASTDPSPGPICREDAGTAAALDRSFSAEPAAPAPAPAAGWPAAGVDWLSVAREKGMFTEQAYAEDLCSKNATDSAASSFDLL